MSTPTKAWHVVKDKVMALPARYGDVIKFMGTQYVVEFVGDTGRQVVLVSVCKKHSYVITAHNGKLKVVFTGQCANSTERYEDKLGELTNLFGAVHCNRYTPEKSLLKVGDKLPNAISGNIHEVVYIGADNTLVTSCSGKTFVKTTVQDGCCFKGLSLEVLEAIK